MPIDGSAAREAEELDLAARQGHRRHGMEARSRLAGVSSIGAAHVVHQLRGKSSRHAKGKVAVRHSSHQVTLAAAAAGIQSTRAEHEGREGALCLAVAVAVVVPAVGVLKDETVAAFGEILCTKGAEQHVCAGSHVRPHCRLRNVVHVHDRRMCVDCHAQIASIQESSRADNGTAGEVKV